MQLRSNWIKVVIGLILLLATYQLVYMAMHCTREGYERSKAIEIAEWKLELHKKSFNLSRTFHLVGERFENHDMSWAFEYKSGDCEIHVAVDRCGATDVAGVSVGCIEPHNRIPTSK